MEVKAGIQFQRIGAPQPAEIIKSAARDAVRYVVLPFDLCLYYCNGGSFDSSVLHQIIG